MSWQGEVEQYCHKYNIPIQHLADILSEPKVVPMIRGKAFEFVAMEMLQKVLPANEWKISKATIEEESFHDTDIRVLHKRTGKVIRVECKLAKKEGYRRFADGHSEIRVKCMRSRTLGIAKVEELAPKLGVASQVLLMHNDQYLPADFDVVVTSIGNAFYRTETGLYEWKPEPTEEEFLRNLNNANVQNLKDFAFHRLYVARTADIAARTNSGVKCSRGKCNNPSNCGFVPNYPVIRFDASTGKPTNGWVPIEDSADLFKRFIIPY